MRLINAATVPRAEKVLRRAQCPASLTVSDCVRIAGPKVGPHLVVELADPLANPWEPAVGVVVRKYTSTLCLVQSNGPMKGVVSGLTPGRPYYVGLGGQLTPTAPASPARVQQMGVAWDADELLLQWYEVGGDGGGGGGDFNENRILTLRWNTTDPTQEDPRVVIEESTGNVMVEVP